MKRRRGREIPPFWVSFALHSPKNGIEYLTPCKIIILRDKLIPQWFFSILTLTYPPPPP